MISFQRFARSRITRLALVGSLFTTAAYGFQPYLFNDVSTQAAINAPLIRLTAATNGTVAELPQDGKYFAKATPISLVELSQNTGQIADLRARAEMAEAQITLSNRQLAELSGQEVELKHRASIFSSTTNSRLSGDYDAAQATLNGCEAERTELSASQARIRKLAAQGFMSPAAVEKADAATAIKNNQCRSAEAKIRSLAATRLAARSGVFLGDGYNDAPYAVQQRDRILLQRQAIERTFSDATAEYKETNLRLKDALARAHYVAPAGTLVWATLASTATSIGEGAPVMDLLDCRRRFVQVALPQRKAETILPNDKADIRLIGASQWLEGHVINITGAAGRRKQDLLAASTYSLPGDREMIVDVALPPPNPGQLNPGRNCDVGRMAEVRFSRRL